MLQDHTLLTHAWHRLVSKMLLPLSAQCDCAGRSELHPLSWSAGMPQHTCAFLHSAAEQEAMQAILRRVAARLHLPASADVSGSVATSSSKAAGADAEASNSRGTEAPARLASRASSQGDGEYGLQGPVAAAPAAQQPPRLGYTEAFPGLTSSKPSTVANSANTTLQQQQQVIDAAIAVRPLSLPDQGAAAPPAGTATTTSVAPASAPQVQAHGAKHEMAMEGADGGISAPQSYDEVDMDTLNFLFQGPDSKTAVQLQWYYIDPYGQVQVRAHRPPGGPLSMRCPCSEAGTVGM